MTKQELLDKGNQFSEQQKRMRRELASLREKQRWIPDPHG